MLTSPLFVSGFLLVASGTDHAPRGSV